MAYPIDSSVKVERLILERVLMYLTTSVTEYPIYLQEPKIHMQQMAHVADQLAVTLRGWMLGNKFPDRSEFDSISYPDGWWEMLKERHAPKWFIERWPVRMKAIRYESARYHYNICPHWNEAFDKGTHIHYAFMAGRPDWRGRDD